MSEKGPTPDELLASPVLRAAYLGRSYTDNSVLWADDPTRTEALKEVTAAFEEHYDASRDLLEEKHSASLAQGSARVLDQWSRNDPNGFGTATGYLRQPLEEFATSDTPADVRQQQLAREIVAWTKAGSPYWDKYHVEHQRYVEAVRGKYEQLYNSAEDGGRRG